MEEIVILNKNNLNLFKSNIEELLNEYWYWTGEKNIEYFNFNLGVHSGFPNNNTAINHYLQHILGIISKYIQPNGRFLLIKVDEVIVGMGALEELSKGIGEIKFMYVKPEYRTNGFGTKILSKLIDLAKEIKFNRIYLHSTGYMKSAHKLYYKFHFNDCEPYFELAKDFPDNFKNAHKYMQLDLK